MIVPFGQSPPSPPIPQDHISNDQLGQTALGQQRQIRSKDTPPDVLKAWLQDYKVTAPLPQSLIAS